MMLLVDYENVQKLDLAAIPPHANVRIFVGASQAKVHDFRVRARAFDARVPGPVVRFAVPAAFTIGVVVLVVVGDKIGERKPVMRCDEVDRCDRLATGVFVQVR